jgi:LPXTG-motif cell wall-anchored protein
MSYNATTSVLTLNLSSLSTASTGASPEFRVVTPDGTSDATALLLTAEVTYESAPPELCFELVVAQNCPAAVGVAPAAAVPAEPVALVSQTVVTVSGVATPGQATVPGTVGDLAGCLGTVVGVAVDGDGDPVAGVPVSFTTGSTTHATVNTDANGHAVFTNVYPFLVSTSALEFKSSSAFRPVSASAVVDLLALTAGNTVTGSAMTYEFAPAIPPPPPTTTTVPASTVPASSTPSTSVPPTTVPSPSTTVVPVRVVDEVGEEILPELAPGESQVFDNGVATVVETIVEESTDLVLRGQDFELRLKGDCSVRLCEVVEENAREVLELDVDGAANVSGYGFKPGTQVHIWLFSEPTYLGWLLVLEDGTFEGSVDLLDVEWGEHTLQVNGISFDDKERTANLGVRINGGDAPGVAPVQLPATGTSTAPWTMALSVMLLALGAVATGRRRKVQV